MRFKAVIGVAAITLCVSTAAARADALDAYAFSGALATSYGGDNSVSGVFVLDQTNGTLGPYLFSTPIGTFNNSNSSGELYAYSPAQSPSENFIQLALLSNTFNILDLVFQTDLATFSGSSFYTGMVLTSGGNFSSALYNGISPYLTPNAAFTGGAATSVDLVKTYDFSGTLAMSRGGDQSVSGVFTLDPLNGTIGNYSLSTPLGLFDNADSSAAVYQFTPALDPNEDFVELSFVSNSMNILTLVFQTDLLAFSGASFYTGLVSIPNGDFASALYNGISPALTPNASFTSGAATPVPEPSTWAMLIVGFGGIGFMMRRRGAPGAQAAKKGAAFFRPRPAGPGRHHGKVNGAGHGLDRAAQKLFPTPLPARAESAMQPGRG